MTPDQWIVSKPARELRAGDRFVFTDAMGGEGEVVTVAFTCGVFDYGTTCITTLELDFEIEWPANSIVPLCIQP